MTKPQDHAATDAPDPSDIRPGDWVDRWLPKAARPYARLMRLDRPIGTWLLLFPCLWGTALATLAPDRHMVWLMVLFSVGALVMRGAGCTWNDIRDREFDAGVARTRTRPIPSGQVTVPQAYLFLCAQLALGLAILLQFNRLTVIVGAASLVLVAIYPLAKRFTFWPQFFLGLAFNYGAWLGWTAVNDSLDLSHWPGAWPAAILYVAGISWTLGYDTIYGHQDKTDDVKVGIKSTALKFATDTKGWLVVFYALTTGLIWYAGQLMGLGIVFWIGLGLGALQLAWQVIDVDLDDPHDCLRKFKSNRLYGWLVLGGLVADPLLQGWV